MTRPTNPGKIILTTNCNSMKATYQYKFYPDTNQKLALNQWLRICRYWYNRQLGDRFDWWEMNRTAINACPLKTSIAAPREKPNYYCQKQQLPILKKDLVKVFHSGELLDFKQVDSTIKSGLNKSWLDAAFGQFFTTLSYIGEKTGAVVVSQKPAYTSMLLCYRNEMVFTDCNIREYWDEQNSLMVDRDLNAAINLKRLGLDIFPSIKRPSGNLSIVGSMDKAYQKEILHTLHRAVKKPTS
ncbi:MAG: helix-turn-helix domain-containing protein [Microcoleus sp.]